MSINKTEEIEVKLITEAIYDTYGYDFSNYAKLSFLRRLTAVKQKNNFKNLSDMIPKIIHNREFFSEFVHQLTVNTTEMFRDGDFFKYLSDTILPKLETYPFIKIWHAGCSTGEEVYSMAILLKIFGLLNRTQIYATDINKEALHTAGEGIYSTKVLKEYKENFNKVFSDNNFLDFFAIKYSSGIADSEFKKKINFSFHNLTVDGVFTEAQLILCRNVMIYFNKVLQNRALSLFHDSLCYGGYLCLGDKETLKFTDFYDKYKTISEKYKIYKKIDPGI